MEKEYAVIVKKGINLSEVEADLKASTGSGPIPSRSVTVANARVGSTRITHFSLTDEEAQELEKDDRIQAVEIPPYLRDDIKIGRRAVQTGIFSKSGTVDNTINNWGLRRCIEDSNIFEGFTEITSPYRYAIDGSGVDVVIQDSGVEPNHPDWNDYNGTNRYVFTNWYTESGLVGTQNANHDRDFDGHGTACASIIGGAIYGWAKNCTIRSQKLSGLEGPGDSGTGISIADAFDSIRLWHANKAVDPVTGYKKPTIVNMSWGYFYEETGDPTSGVYRGTSWAWPADYSTDATLWAATGVVPPLSGATRTLPNRNAFADAEVDDMIAAGIHVVIASGNEYYKQDVSTGLDYNNSVTINGTSYNYHRGTSPYSEDAFNVGAIDTTVFLDGSTYKDKIANYSNRGPQVNIYAPGNNITCANSTTTIYTESTYPTDASYKITNIDGTSFAAPQVAGVIALHAQVRPDITPTQMLSRIIADTKNVIYETGSTTDYNLFSTSLLGSPNRMLFSRYGKSDTLLTSGTYTMANAGIDFTNEGASQDLINQGITNSTEMDIERTWSQGTFNYDVAVRVPNTKAEQSPVCILLHGNGGNGSGILNDFSDVIPNHILVSPTGYGASWNISEENSNGPDVDVVKQLIANLKTFPNVDTTKIRILGVSNGGALAVRCLVEIDDPSVDIICNIISQTHDEQYRGGNWYYPSNHEQTGSAYTNLGYDTQKTMPTRKYIQLNGTTDSTVPFAGGTALGVTFLSASDSALRVAETQGSGGTPTTTAWGSGNAQITTYDTTGNDVVFFTDTVGHTVSTEHKKFISQYFMYGTTSYTDLTTNAISDGTGSYPSTTSISIT